MSERGRYKQLIYKWPCTQDCPDRKQGCHSTCKKYAEAKKKNDALKASIDAKRMSNGVVSKYIAERVCKCSGKPFKQR